MNVILRGTLYLVRLQSATGKAEKAGTNLAVNENCNQGISYFNN